MLFTPERIKAVELTQVRQRPIKYVTVAKETCWPPSELNEKFLPGGLALGVSSADGKCHVIRGSVFSAAEASGQTTLSVTHPERFRVGDNVKAKGADGTPAEQNLGAVTAVDIAAGTITVTTATTAAFDAGDYIYVSPSTDNDIDVARYILKADVWLYDATHNLVDAEHVPVMPMMDQGDPFDAARLTKDFNLFPKARTELEARGFRFWE